MDVILLKDIDNLGYKHEIVTVKNGYGRNFLIPQKLAVIANTQNLGMLDDIKAKQAAKREAKLTGETISAEAIVCRELAVIGEPLDADKPAPIIVHAGRVRGGAGGRIEIRDATGTDAVAIGTTAEGRDGGVEFFDAQGALLGKLGPKATKRE